MLKELLRQKQLLIVAGGVAALAAVVLIVNDKHWFIAIATAAGIFGAGLATLAVLLSRRG